MSSGAVVFPCPSIPVWYKSPALVSVVGYVDSPQCAWFASIASTVIASSFPPFLPSPRYRRSHFRPRLGCWPSLCFRRRVPVGGRPGSHFLLRVGRSGASVIARLLIVALLSSSSSSLSRRRAADRRFAAVRRLDALFVVLVPLSSSHCCCSSRCSIRSRSALVFTLLLVVAVFSLLSFLSSSRCCWPSRCSLRFRSTLVFVLYFLLLSLFLPIVR